MQDENEEFKRFKECHPLPVHWPCMAFVLLQKPLADLDQTFEARQTRSIIDGLRSDLNIIEFDRSHTCTQECTEEQSKVFGWFCHTGGIEVNKANFSTVHQHLRRTECAMGGDQLIWL